MEYKVALITGAGSGIGRRAGPDAVAAWARPSPQSITARTDSRNWKTTSRPSRDAVPCAVLDVTDAARLCAASAELEKTLGPVDLLIASAGLGLETSGLDYQIDVMNKVMNVNLLGVSNSIAAVLPGMLRRKRGHLVALSSIASFRGLPRMLAYCASKAGVNAMMEGLRIEIEHEGVFTTTICPGWIRTPMTPKIAGRTPKMLEVDDAARRILWAIQKKRRFYAFPAGMVWQMRILNLLPRFLRDRLFRKMMRSMSPQKTVAPAEDLRS